jgi:hypothetical protein
MPPNMLASFLLVAGLMKLGGEISSSPDSNDDDDPEKSESAANGPEKIGTARRCDPSFPTRKWKLPNVISIGSSR